MTIVPHNHDFAREQCIEAAFKSIGEPTDWDAVIGDAANLNPEALTAEIVAGQPYEKTAENELKIFRLQTRVRIALRYRKGLPQYDAHTCSDCGSRKADPVRHWGLGSCIHCAEKEMLFPGEGQGGYHGGLRVAFDVSNNSWGIAYESKDDRQRTAGIIVTGYPNRDEAFIGRNAPDRFYTIFNQVCPAGHEIEGDAIINTGELFRQNLPLNPEQWRQFITRNMRAATTTESEPYEQEIKAAMSEYFKKSH